MKWREDLIHALNGDEAERREFIHWLIQEYLLDNDVDALVAGIEIYREALCLRK